MSVARGPSIVKNGLALCLDAADKNSYPGSGTTWYDMNAQNLFNSVSSSYVYPSFVDDGASSYFSFVNDGVTNNDIYCPSPITTTKTQTAYTRISWFYLNSLNTTWSSIFANEIGNNGDMALMISSVGKVRFHQYTNALSSGTANGDYSVDSTGTVSTNTWNFAAIAVDLSARTISFYINGNLDRTATGINIIGNSGSDKMSLGGPVNYSSARTLKGRIAAIYHYSRLLSASEILQNFNATKKRYGI